MICKNCQFENVEGARFCASCGTPLELQKTVEEVKEEAVITNENKEEAVEVVTDNIQETVEQAVEEPEVVVPEVVEEVAAPIVEEPIVQAPVEVPVETPVAASTFAQAAVAEATTFETVPVSEPVNASPIAAAAAATAATTATVAAAPVEPAPSKKALKEQKKYEKQAKIRAVLDSIPAEYQPMSTSSYFWFMLLAALPGIGFIITLIMSFVGKNKNRKNLFRAILVYYIIGLIIALAVGVVLVFVLPDLMADIYYSFEDIISEFV